LELVVVMVVVMVVVSCGSALERKRMQNDFCGWLMYGRFVKSKQKKLVARPVQ
jgi:hypothetical protein